MLANLLDEITAAHPRHHMIGKRKADGRVSFQQIEGPAHPLLGKLGRFEETLDKFTAASISTSTNMIFVRPGELRGWKEFDFDAGLWQSRRGK
jgi:hypothetical protein